MGCCNNDIHPRGCRIEAFLIIFLSSGLNGRPKGP